MAQIQTKNKSIFWSSIAEFIALLMIIFLIRTIGFGLYQVPTGSMETTMLVGERFFADKFTYKKSNCCILKYSTIDCFKYSGCLFTTKKPTAV